MLCYNTGVGKLYLVATPIGNLEDISLRALRVLRQVDLIAAEDTRHTRKLLAHYEIDTPLLSYHEHSNDQRLQEILQRLQGADVALVSDAGSPLISDPGYELIRAAVERGVSVVPIPGASAVITALSAAGLPSDAFLFQGYLPRKRKERRALLEQQARYPYTLVFFEVPHRLQASLNDLVEILGPERPAAVCRELTKVHEEIVRGDLGEILNTLGSVEPRGEYTLVVAGASGPTVWTEGEVRKALQERIAYGDKPSDAARWVASHSGWPRPEVYKFTLEEE
ncbi:MAG: 16S rRNA (cytidine(1402)-2'-O)-methyltransferase [Anaerolineales bacterium]